MSSKRPAPDFKRIKAKVGKRAIKPANVTDLSFKTASVSVQRQTVSADESGRLVSTRGRSLESLVGQLHHPAAAMRLSALRGLGNIASENDELQTCIHVFIPAVTKCSVDVDDQVRTLALQVLKDSLQSIPPQQIAPFVPLLTAHVTCALNSLDRSTRLDASRAVDILANTLPTFMNSQVQVLLPAYGTLLADHSSARSSKKKDTANRFIILQSLVSLLRTIPEKQGVMWDAGVTISKPDLVFGTTSNAVLVVDGQRQDHFVRSIQNLDDLTNFGDSQKDAPENQSLTVTVATDLANKLRDLFVEVTQRGRGERALYLAANDIEELGLVVAAIQLFWNTHCQDINDDGLKKVYTNLVSLLLEAFPVRPQNASTDLKYDLLNAGMCATLMDIGGSLNDSKQSMDWTRRVLDYILPSLDSNASAVVVDVLARLFLLSQNNMEFTLPDKTRYLVLEKVCLEFFSDKESDTETKRCAAARRAVQLIVVVLSQQDYQVASLQMAVKALPSYLQAWGGDFLSESTTVLSALHNVARRIHADDSLAQSLRGGIGVIFAIPKSKKRSRIPIFCMYPPEVQRLALGLVVMLDSPSDDVLNGLGNMCGRGEGTVTPAIADAISHAIYNVRRSMSMQTYLSFVIKSIGISKTFAKKTKRSKASGKEKTGSPTSEEAKDQSVATSVSDTSVDMNVLKATDTSLVRATSCLTLCGSAKVLPMITPVLTEWLTANDLDLQNKLVRFRAATTIIAMLLLDIQSLPAVSFVEFAPELARETVRAVCNVFVLCSSKTVGEKETFGYILQPILALMKNDERFVVAVLEETLTRISGDTTNVPQDSAYVDALLTIVRNPELASVLRKAADHLMKCCKSIESTLASGSLERRAGSLCTTVELLVGNTNNDAEK